MLPDELNKSYARFILLSFFLLFCSRMTKNNGIQVCKGLRNSLSVPSLKYRVWLDILTFLP
jgi:hypothetical protein